MEKKGNIAVLGFGYWGKNLVRNFHKLGALRVICDKGPVREKAAKEYPDIPFTSDIEKTLENPEIDAVAISTPASTHYEIAKRAILSGKDVFVEKPLSLNVRQGEELISLASQHQRILMVGHILRYHPAIIRLSELINNGDIGRLQYIYSNRLNMGKIRTEENILWSFAPHDISVILALLDEEPSSVLCQGKAYLHHEVADVTNSYFTFPSGVSAHIFVSWLHPFKEQRLVVIGSEKMAVFDDTVEDKLVVYPHRVEWKQRIPTAIKAEKEVIYLSDREPLMSELEHFITCVKERKQPLTDGKEGLRVLKVLERCEESMAIKRQQQQLAPHPEKRTDDFFAHESAHVDMPCTIGKGTKIWHYSHIMKGAVIGKNCSFGQNCNVAEKVIIGDNVKVQNNVSIYAGTNIDDDVFLGPSCVLTNVTNPRSQVNRHGLYEKTHLLRGATIGANATIICGVTIGRYAFVGAGAVVTRNVPDYALVIGGPAKQAGWMSRHGHRLRNPDKEGTMICPESKYRYREVETGILRCLDLEEDHSLPGDQAKGTKNYASYKILGE